MPLSAKVGTELGREEFLSQSVMTLLFLSQYPEGYSPCYPAILKTNLTLLNLNMAEILLHEGVSVPCENRSSFQIIILGLTFVHTSQTIQNIQWHLKIKLLHS